MSKQTYESAYGATRKITASARIAEIMCGRIARKEGRPIGQRFWTKPEWIKTFRAQQSIADSLLKTCQPTAVFRVIEGNPGLYSLGFPGIKQLVYEEQLRVDAQIEKTRSAEIEEPAAADSGPRAGSTGGKKSIRSLLGEM